VSATGGSWLKIDLPLFLLPTENRQVHKMSHKYPFWDFTGVKTSK
jgi:hypothetical protein